MEIFFVEVNWSSRDKERQSLLHDDAVEFTGNVEGAPEGIIVISAYGP